MRIVPVVIAGLISISSAIASEIREFSVSTLEKLGNELALRDEIAANASDAVLETQSAAKAMKLRGWIIELGKSTNKVHLIAETALGPRIAYTVTFRGSDIPKVEDRHGQPLPPDVAVRYKARQTAIAALEGKTFDAKYNFEVLNESLAQSSFACPSTLEIEIDLHSEIVAEMFSKTC